MARGLFRHYVQAMLGRRAFPVAEGNTKEEAKRAAAAEAIRILMRENMEADAPGALHHV